MSEKWYPIVAWICIFLTINHGEQFFMCLLAIKISSLKKCFSSFAHFKNWILFLLLSCVSSLYSLDINPLLYIYFANIYFQLIGCLSFCCLLPRSFLIWCRISCLYLLLLTILLMLYHWQDQCQGFFPLSSSKNVMVSGLIFKFSIHVNFCDWMI